MGRRGRAGTLSKRNLDHGERRAGLMESGALESWVTVPVFRFTKYT